MNGTRLSLAQSFVKGSETKKDYYLLSFRPEKVVLPSNTLKIWDEDHPETENLAGQFSVKVNPGPVSSNTSYTVGLTEVNTALGLMDFKVHLLDEFGNQWFNDTANVRVSVSVSGTESLILSKSSSGIMQEGSGVYNIRFTPRRSSYYQLPNGDALPPCAAYPIVPLALNSPRMDNLTVNSATANATHTYPKTVDPTTQARPILIAGEPRVYQIHLRDTVDNQLISGNGDPIHQASAAGFVQAFFYFEPACTSTGAVNASQNATKYFNDSTIEDNDDGSYDISMVGTKADRFVVDVRVNGQSINPLCTNFVPIRVIPAQLDPAISKLQGPAINKTSDNLAGLNITIELVLKDRFGNDIVAVNQSQSPLDPNQYWPDRVSIFAPPEAATTEPNRSTWFDNCTDRNFLYSDTPLNLNHANTSTPARPGVFTGSILQQKARTYGLAVWIRRKGSYNDSLVDWANYSDFQYKKGSPCRSLTILPWCVYNWTIQDNGNLRAGRPGVVTIIGYDRYMNLVTTKKHWWDATADLLDPPPTRDELDIYRVLASSRNSSGNHTLNYTLHWGGNYSLLLQLNKDPQCVDEPIDDSMQTSTANSIGVATATCMASGTGKYRCPDDSCKADAGGCPPITAAGTCSNKTCGIGGATWCQWDNETCGTVSQDRFPAWAAAECLLGNVQEKIRAEGSGCPSTRVCPPYNQLCSDQRTCVFNSPFVDNRCPLLTEYDSCTSAYPVRCESGKCVRNLTDCATPVSCPSDASKLCPDGSCVSDNSNCPSTYQCFSPTTFRCPDGSCRNAFRDCPSEVTCPPGWLKCANGHCRKTLAECGNANCATLGQVRCPDGTCIETFDLCPSRVSCHPESPVLCADRTCAETLSLCTTPPVCSVTKPFACPSGECASNASACSTNPTCPSKRPVLCADNTCQATIEGCAGKSKKVCPLSKPFRCFDGSCAVDYNDCPSSMRCPDDAPVRCATGGCVTSFQMCPSAPQDCRPGVSCPLDTPDGKCVACPGGGCASSLVNCPTAITCPPNHVRCGDSSCRESCDGLPRHDECPYGLFPCPNHESGHSCVAKMEDCPQSPSCPRERPIRCADRSCRLSHDLCPPARGPCPKDRPVRCHDQTCKESHNKCPAGPTSCAGNAWAPRCQSQSTTCPPWLPQKCWDDTCRLLVEDCPPEPKCRLEDPDPTKARPFLCAQSSCGAKLTDCAPMSECATRGALSKKVKCPFADVTNTGCVDDARECPNPFDPERASINCKDGARCYDGSCRYGSCPAARECPHYVSYICNDGRCARYQRDCVSEKTLTEPCKNQTAALKNQTAGSGSNETYYRCADGLCETKCDRTTFAPKSGVYSLAMACPLATPVKCPNGYCARSHAFCPTYQRPVCSVNFPFTCADGTCAATGAACPVIKACPAPLVQCPKDGSCVQDLEMCTEQTKKCKDTTPFLCADNMCAVEESECINASTGCKGREQKCGDGFCGQPCPYQQFAANGCPAGSPIRCWNGACVDSASCPAAPVGCSPLNKASPDCAFGDCPTGQVRCADGECAASLTQCKTAQGCPLSTPFRCVDGSCRKYAASTAETAIGSGDFCQPAPACPDSYPFLCFDGKCVTAPQYCPAFHKCPKGFESCSTLSMFDQCRPQGQDCPAATNPCPPAAPTLCPSGACRISYRECDPRPGPLCKFPQGFKCFDGSCQSRPLDCIERGLSATVSSSRRRLAFSENQEHSCSAGFSLCWDGACYPRDSSYCPVLPACPDEAATRCPDGSCTNVTAKSCVDPKAMACPGGTVRCLDGACRRQGDCSNVLFNGCTSQPGRNYYCRRKAQSCVADEATCNSGLQEVCATECFREQPALPQLVSVPLDHDVTIDVSLSNLTTPVTWLEVPAGAFGSRASLRITPVSLLDLDGGYYVLNQQQKPVQHAQILRSTPFKCEVRTMGPFNSKFPLNVTVWGKADREQFAEPGKRLEIVAPCEWRGKWGVRARCGGASLPGNLTVGKTDLNLLINPDNVIPSCPDETEEGTCLCYNISRIGTITNLTATSPTKALTLDQGFCMSFVALTSIYRAFYHTDPAEMHKCPTYDRPTDVLPGRASLRLSREENICQTEGKAGEVRPNDLCFGYLLGGKWSCVQGYYERIDFPTWDPSSGERSFVMRGRLDRCIPGAVYGFLNIPLPPEPVAARSEQSIWEKYGDTILGVSISFCFVAVCIAFIITRLVRYRNKYKREKKEAEQLREQAAEYQEKMGGLGMWDDDMEMVTNPLVLKISEEKKKLDDVNDKLAKQEAADEAEAERLEKDRQQILAEMKRLADKLAEAQSKNTARVDYDTAPPVAAVVAAPGASRQNDYGDDDAYGGDYGGGDDGGGGFDTGSSMGAKPKKRDW
eukprot:g32627.t1